MLSPGVNGTYARSGSDLSRRSWRSLQAKSVDVGIDERR